ncbi:MAG: hypothetical protein UT87_C0001G0005 [Candidatus Levybacteria bacterium GW2011_GWC1_40_19]|nr:MAG: hypothetical protein UT87_C0001G0005 [Candidatus Levybacteria bacterium GW2011_GWC1_40_19]OGH25313.1 MAG: hypothetical protein A3D82_00345 [Candidatus Levybacteria bacterium RIFCSPHIGHO2_02_FULL_40_29]OGH50643.1 MAG: hypothetical protein A3J18_00580 [Candidatus Levybacteria bacterium RIFCSPLOWO2_02_FULL_40_18]OGH52980.1 MAG: hypothetical protein A3H20_02995 [Candidatus Levybacteria bacterium RIFCSPLOWO2_12_FULL_41_12]OGH55193.1 MAG: hypothetical protein A2596_02410 [Candidatus Levybacte
MITVPEATEKIIRRSRYLSEALSKDIINISGLARYIKPEIEAMLIKKVSLSSIIMALKRLSGNIYPDTPYQEIFKIAPEITAKTNLAILISDSNIKDSVHFLETQASTGTVILGKKEDLSKYAGRNSRFFYPVSSISISIPKDAIDTPGIYYFFVKSLAWERINILQVFTSPMELTIVVSDKDMQRTLEILRSLFRRT